MLKYLSSDEENGIMIEPEFEDSAQEEKKYELKDFYHYTFRNMTEFIFGDANGSFKSSVSIIDKRLIFDKFIAPLVMNYKNLQDKFLELFRLSSLDGIVEDLNLTED